MILNSKSILDCNEVEELFHNQEIKYIEERLFELPNYECAVVLKYIDIANNGRKEVYMQCYLHNFLDMIEYTDSKNGVDLIIGDNNILAIVSYGQNYVINGNTEYVTTYIYIMPYDENREFLDISSYLNGTNFMEDNTIFN